MISGNRILRRVAEWMVFSSRRIGLENFKVSFLLLFLFSEEGKTMFLFDLSVFVDRVVLVVDDACSLQSLLLIKL